MSELFGELIVGFGVNAAVVAAGQKFDRQLKQWEFSIEKQKLFREDIRDLVQLTVGRMDMYHLVGALLLEFAMSFYCSNELLQPEQHRYPTWLISLFMMNNFCAIGFLTLAVWLSMHASVASHSIGVRLLLRLTRLDVPSPDAIAKLKVPLSSLFGSASVPEQNPTMAANTLVDERNHFKEFLQRQRVWLGYDAYARFCMSLGMNAMLTALSYHIIGRISAKTSVSAFSALLGVQLLSVLLLVLDVRHDRPESESRNRRELQHQRCFVRSAVTNRDEAIAVLCLLVVPPIFALFLVLLWPHMQKEEHIRSNACLSTVSFVLHACWLEYLYIMESQTTDDMLPRRMRTVEFMDVMSPDELELEAEDAQTHLHQARSHLQDCMVSDNQEKLRSLMAKLSSQLQHAHRARSMAFAAERPDPHAEPMEAREGPRDSGLQRSREAARSRRESLDEEILQSQQLLTCCKDIEFLQSMAPQVVGNLRSLQKVGGLKPEQEIQVARLLEQIPDRYEECRRQCLGGIEQAGGGKTHFAMGELRTEYPLPVVALAREDEQSRAQVWECFRPEDPLSVLTGKPANRRGTSFGEAMTLSLSWNQTYTALTRPDRAEVGRDSSDLQHEFSSVENPQHGSAADQCDNSNAQLPQMSDKLPQDVVRSFMRGCMFLWLFSAVAQFVQGVLLHEVSLQSAVVNAIAIEAQQLEATWPTPADLFQTGALQCVNDSVLLVSSPSKLYAIHGQPWTAGLHEIQEMSSLPAGTVLCNNGSCDALVWDTGEWKWVPVSGLAGSGQLTTSVPIPASWRLVAATWEVCSDASGLCESAFLAGWTGAEIEIAEAQLELDSGSWRVENRFTVPADVAACDVSPSDGGCPATGAMGAYTDVRALQLGKGRTLAVLLGEGRLDGWDLRNGIFLGQWRLGHDNYTSMCHGTHEIVFVQSGGDSVPQLGVAALPAELSTHR